MTVKGRVLLSVTNAIGWGSIVVQIMPHPRGCDVNCRPRTVWHSLLMMEVMSVLRVWFLSGHVAAWDRRNLALKRVEVC